jgi:hypothetical protein
MSDGLFHVRTVEEVLSDDNSGASDNAGCTSRSSLMSTSTLWTSLAALLPARPQQESIGDRVPEHLACPGWFPKKSSNPFHWL